MREYYADQTPRTPPLSHSATFVVATLLLAAVFIYWLIWTRAYHYTDLQTAEFLVYALLAIAVPGFTILVLVKRKEWRENQRRYPPLVMDPSKDAKHVERAWDEGGVVLGYDVHGEPWFWPDKVRVMQGIVLGMTGSGKTTLLENISTQDL